MEFILEFFINVWFELAMKLVPNNNKHSPIAVLVCKLITLFVILYVVVAFTVGSIILVDNIDSRPFGIILLSSSVLIFAFQIVLGIIFYNKKQK